MKTTLLFLALACSLVSAEPPTSGSILLTPEQMKTNSVLSFTPEQMEQWSAMQTTPAVILRSGYTPRLQVGDAVLTKKSVLGLIATLRANLIVADGFAKGVATRFPQSKEDEKLIYQIAMVRALTNHHISELQKLADALAEEKP